LSYTTSVNPEPELRAVLPRTPVLEGLPLAARRLCVAEYYECRLEPQAQQVDYLCALQREGARQLLGSGVFLGEAKRGPLERLLTTWLEDESLLATRVPFIWLEFDDMASRAEAPPSVSVCLVPNYRVERVLPDGVRARHLETAVSVLQELQPETAHHDARLLEECFAALPAGGRWIHLSVMLGREPQAVKLYGVFPRAELLPYLKAIEWCGNFSAIEALLRGPYCEELVGNELYVDLNLENFRDPARASLGLAVSQQHALRGPEPDPSRAKVLSSWVAEGLASPAKAEAGQRWLDRREHFLDLKLVWQGGITTPKAYLGVLREPN
jgi:hypothetical protein